MCFTPARGILQQDDFIQEITLCRLFTQLEQMQLINMGWIPIVYLLVNNACEVKFHLLFIFC